MNVRLKPKMMVVTPESPEELQTVASWLQKSDGHVFAVRIQPDQTFLMLDLGPRPVACREAINVTSRSPEPAIKLISNFAHTPFVVDGTPYGSVEAFWQGLKFPQESRRLEIAPLFGDEARRAGFDAPESATIKYRGATVRVGTSDHWRLMRIACWSKFTQHNAAKQALLQTGQRPLVHNTRKDSRNIPGVVMSDIWMKVRKGLINRISNEAPSGEGAV
jgi:predicted NAD-dependent protein-ADP-ribosyltransferase YbiA (DUF1768 family)